MLLAYRQVSKVTRRLLWMFAGCFAAACNLNPQPILPGAGAESPGMSQSGAGGGPSASGGGNVGGSIPLTTGGANSGDNGAGKAALGGLDSGAGAGPSAPSAGGAAEEGGAAGAAGNGLVANGGHP